LSGLSLFDTHCHLSGKALRERGGELLQNAQGAGVRGICLIATNEEDLAHTSACAEKWQTQFPDLKICHTSGIHPHEAHTFTESYWSKVEAHAQNAHAIGETGLDFFYDFSDRQTQIDVFARHIDLAIRTQKPLVIHCRNSATEILDQLEASAISQKTSHPGILHCFTESTEIANRCLDLGLMISLSGILTFKSAESLRKTVAEIPLERLLIETDSPYLAPIPHRGRDNEPAFVEKTFEALASIRNETKEVLGHALWQNSCRIFSIES
jgi:TatD DNase family protein